MNKVLDILDSMEESRQKAAKPRRAWRSTWRSKRSRSKVIETKMRRFLI